MHGNVFGGRFVAFKLDHHTDARAVQVRRQLGAAGKALEPAKAHVLADLANQALAHVFERRAESVLAMRQCTERKSVSRIVLGNQRDCRVGHGQEAVTLGDKVGFAVDFEDCAGGAIHAAGDHAFGGDAAGGFAGLAAELDAQQLFGLDHVAFGFGQGAFAFHHRRIGLATQFGDHACGNCSHFDSPNSIRYGSVQLKGGVKKGHWAPSNCPLIRQGGPIRRRAHSLPQIHHRSRRQPRP